MRMCTRCRKEFDENTVYRMCSQCRERNRRYQRELKEREPVSLFDGISCGMIALERACIKVDKYYASEIEFNAIAVSKRNYPNIIQLGDVTKWRDWDIDWSKIDLLIGGSPCQGFSSSGKELNFKDPRSKLFFEYNDILNHIKSINPEVKFLLDLSEGE